MSIPVKILVAVLLVTWTRTCLASNSSNCEAEDDEEFYPSRAELKCGIGTQKGSIRVIGGKPARPGGHPWTLYLDLGRTFCGGVVIGTRWILTAKHCVRGRRPKDVIIRAGQHSIGDPVEVQESRASKIFEHPEADTALVRIDKRLKFGITSNGYGSVNKICLPKEGQKYAGGEKVVLSGWGLTRKIPDKWPDQIHDVTLDIIGLAECRRIELKPNSRYEICAGKRGGGKDSCNGDSGGPLVRRTAGKQFELVGIVSRGPIMCGTPQSYAGIYVAPAKIMGWIKKIIGGGDVDEDNH